MCPNRNGGRVTIPFAVSYEGLLEILELGGKALGVSFSIRYPGNHVAIILFLFSGFCVGRIAAEYLEAIDGNGRSQEATSSGTENCVMHVLENLATVSSLWHEIQSIGAKIAVQR